MGKECLKFNIIDRFKKSKSSSLRKSVLIGVSSFVSILIYLPNFNGLSFNPFYLKGILILLAGIVVPFALTYALQSPSKGTIEFQEELITILIGKTKTEILLSNDIRITFYEYPSLEQGTSYIIELGTNERLFHFELDIVFSKEKEELEIQKTKWRENGVLFKVINTPPNTPYTA